MQGSVGSYASNGQHLPIHHDSIERGLSGEFGSLAFNELSDLWGDIRLYSHETATAAMFSSQKLEWNEASASCMTSGDPATATASVEYQKPLGERSSSSSIPPWPETSTEENDLECRQPAKHSKPWPVVTCSTGVHVDPTLIYLHAPPRLPRSEDVALHLSSGCQSHIPERPLSPSLQPLSSRRTRFHPQSLERSGVQDASVGELFTHTVIDSMVSGTRQHNFFQQAPNLSMSRSPDIDRRRETGKCGTGGKANHFTSENLSPLQFKQPNEPAVERPASRKYQRRRAVNGIDMEVNGTATTLDHVQRERQRRDLMTSKIAALELLLPKSSKRDRVSVVYDSIDLLKRLKRDVMVLQRRFHDLKERRRSGLSARYRNSISKSIDCNMRTRGSYFSNGNVIKGVGKYMKPVVLHTHPTWDKSENSRPTPTQRSSTISSAQSLEEGNILEKGDVMVEFHVHLDDTVTIQEEKLVKCRCRMDYLRVMMGVVDEFRLEVISCNIMKLCGYFTCILGLKTGGRKEKTTAAQFAIRLQSVVDVDMYRWQRSHNQSIGLESPKD